MSKQEYAPPTGQPAGWGDKNQGSSGYNAAPAPSYNNQSQERGWGGQQGGYPQQGGYQQGYPPQQGGYQQGYPPQQGGYYNQQQPQYVVQQQKPSKGGGGGCLTGCLAAMCVCCTLDMLF